MLQPQSPAPPDAGAVSAGAAIVVLLVVAAAALALWLARRALRGPGASAEQRTRSAAEREEAFLEMTLAMHQARQRGAPAPTSTARASGFEGTVHCPTCAAALGPAGAMLRFVTKCPGCARRVAARVEGARVSVEVEP